MEQENTQQNNQGKFFEGIVVKSAMKDTVTVQVERYEKHPKYKKYMRRSKKFLVHNPGNTVAVGDRVTIKETRPISRMKRFIISAHIPKVEKAEKAPKAAAQQ